MKTYGIVMYQGNGCDYTIGCGIAFETYQAASIEEAFQKWTDSREMNLENEPGIAGHYFPGEEGELQLVKVFEISGGMNQSLWPEFVKRRLAEQELAAIAGKEAKELAEFERLKKKLGK